MTYLLALLVLPFFASLALAQSAVAIIYLNALNSSNIGSINFTQPDSRSVVSIVGIITGLGANKTRGLHIHELGDTTLGCDSTGGHYNQEMMAHGDRTNTTRHVGDLGNIVSDLDGTAQLNFTVDKVSLFRKESNSVFGRAIVIHESADDFGINGSQTGNSGSRFACGIISINKPVE